MKKYTVELRATKDVEIEAETPHEAIRLAIEQNPDYHPDCIFDAEGNFKSVESCNGCGLDMLDDEVGGHDTAGNSYCKECHKASQIDYREWLHELTKLGYSKGVMIPAEYKEEVDEQYGETPADALAYLIENNFVTKLE